MFPDGFLERMAPLLGGELEAFLASYDRPRQAGLRLNPHKTDRCPDITPFVTGPISWARDGYFLRPGARPGLHPYHEAGLYYLQEPSAMAPAALLDARPGERVLDLCAAPGGKSTQIAAALAGRGLLVSNEVNPKRARILSRNFERMGVINALVLNEDPRRLQARFAGYFDKILVDAPCSGEGMFRKEPDAVSDWSEQIVQMCARRQQEILSSAAEMLRPGGRLVYSTCTFSPEENEGVISQFLKSHSDFAVEALEVPWFCPGRPDWIADPAPGLEHTFRLWPHRLPGEGHFAAVLRRQGAGADAQVAPEKAQKLPQAVEEFLKPLAPLPDGMPLLFAGQWYWTPAQLPNLAGLRVLRPGLELGEVRKDRFLPAHALALFCKTAPQTADFAGDSPEIAAYLRGETVPGSQKGWTLVTVDGCSIGWAKGDGSQLKNHYPKGLRRP